MPSSRSAPVNAAETSSSSVISRRGAASNRHTRVPKALKIDATWAPVAPAPITIIDPASRQAPGVAVRGGELTAGDVGAAARRPCRARSPRREAAAPSRSRSVVGSDEAGSAGVLEDGDACLLQLVAQQRPVACPARHLLDALEQALVVDRDLAGDDPVRRKVARLPDQPRRLGQRRTGTGPSFAAMPPKSSRVTSAVRRPQPRSPQRRTMPAWTGADHHHVEGQRLVLAA